VRTVRTSLGKERRLQESALFTSQDLRFQSVSVLLTIDRVIRERRGVLTWQLWREGN